MICRVVDFSERKMLSGLQHTQFKAVVNVLLLESLTVLCEPIGDCVCLDTSLCYSSYKKLLTAVHTVYSSSVC